MLAEQGAHYTDGLLPPATNVADSPMQAWHDNISLPSSSGSSSSSVGDNMLMGQQEGVQINTVILAEGSFADLHAELWAKITMAKAVMNKSSSPDVLLENCRFLSFNIQMSASMLHEMVGEFFSLHQQRRVARKTLEQNSPSTTSTMSLQAPNDFMNMQLVAPEVGQKRKDFSSEASTSATPICTTLVRRSTRSSRFQGFKTKNMSEAKPIVSKVKARKIPTMQEVAHSSSSASAENEEMEIPATPVPVLQSIGINLCGVPPEEVSPQKLMETSKDKTED
jgi:hypothetical protein